MGSLLVVHGSSERLASDQSGQQYLAGICAGIVVAFSQAIFIVAMKPLLRSQPWRKPLAPGLIMRLAYAVASCASLMGFACLVAQNGLEPSLAEWTSQDTLISPFAGIVCGAMNYSLFAYANRVLSATTCSLYSALQPPLTAILAYTFRGESLSSSGCCSILFVIASIFVAVQQQQPTPQMNAKETSGLLASEP